MSVAERYRESRSLHPIPAASPNVRGFSKANEVSIEPRPTYLANGGL